MEKPEIKKLEIISGTGVRNIKVGDNGVVEIKDESIEYPDALHIIYYVYGMDNKLLTTVENCPVVVDYK